MSCRALTGEKMVVTPKGLVYPCVAMKNMNIPCEFNNIRKYKLKNIMKVWEEIMKPFKDAVCGECPAQLLINCKICIGAIKSG